jgi:hypothetical protein
MKLFGLEAHDVSPNFPFGNVACRCRRFCTIELFRRRLAAERIRSAATKHLDLAVGAA